MMDIFTATALYQDKFNARLPIKGIPGKKLGAAAGLILAAVEAGVPFANDAVFYSGLGMQAPPPDVSV
jgi:hypothetical protein